VKWAVTLLLLVCLLVPAQEKRQCIVSDFYGVSWIGDPGLRHMQLAMWLTTNGNNCNTEQLLVIWNNLAMWAGAADSAELRGKVLYYYARAAEREKK
jgi:hypothetical protein